jgi:hypothetical protein
MKRSMLFSLITAAFCVLQFGMGVAFAHPHPYFQYCRVPEIDARLTTGAIAFIVAAVLLLAEQLRGRNVPSTSSE